MSRSLTVILDVTERCNLRCVMCHFSRVERIHFPPFDLVPEDHGNMSVALFERIAAQFFPRARRVALGCAAEPLMHPRFAALLEIASRHRVPELWFPTNLLPLTEATAEAIARHVTTIGVSIDGTRKETYERIRTGASWERLHAKLRMLRETGKPPRLRVIFTWMRSNRAELRELPEFAADLGARELDVRYVAPAIGVDISSETLAREEPRQLHAQLAAAARDAVRRGLRLSAWPKFDDRPDELLARVAWRFWRVRAGLDRVEDFVREREEHAFVIRPSGAVFPCEHHGQPLGFAGVDSMLTIAKREPPCATCAERRNAMYALRGGTPPGRRRSPFPAAVNLRTFSGADPRNVTATTDS